MSDPKQRLIVDGIELGRVFQFHRMLRSATSSMQPPRLIIGLFMVVLLVAVGKVWDRWIDRDPWLMPGQLIGEEWTAEDADAAKALMWEAMQVNRVPNLPEHWNTGTDYLSKVDKVLEHLERDYWNTRGRLETGQSIGTTTTDEEDLEGLPPGVLHEKDRVYLNYIQQIRGYQPRGPFEATSESVIDCFNRTMRGVIFLKPRYIEGAARDLFIHLPQGLWNEARWFTIVYGLFFTIVFAIGGGALSRMAVCDFSGQERLRIRDAFDFALGNWVKLVLTPLLPLMIAGGLAVVMILLGLLLAPWINIVGGPLYTVVVLVGFLLAFLLIGYALGFPMLLPAVATENCGPADAQQRAYAYVLTRPLHLLGYSVVGLIGLVIGYVVVAMVAVTMLNFSGGLAGTFSGSSALAEAGHVSIFNLHVTDPGAIHQGLANWPAWWVSFCHTIVVDLVIAYVVAYVFTASSILYLLMRRTCDGQDVEEIWRPGLAPGTLVPLPKPRVGPSATDGDDLAE